MPESLCPRELNDIYLKAIGEAPSEHVATNYEQANLAIRAQLRIIGEITGHIANGMSPMDAINTAYAEVMHDGEQLVAMNKTAQP